MSLEKDRGCGEMWRVELIKSSATLRLYDSLYPLSQSEIMNNTHSVPSLHVQLQL